MPPWEESVSGGLRLGCRHRAEHPGPFQTRPADARPMPGGLSHPGSTGAPEDHILVNCSKCSYFGLALKIAAPHPDLDSTLPRGTAAAGLEERARILECRMGVARNRRGLRRDHKQNSIEATRPPARSFPSRRSPSLCLARTGHPPWTARAPGPSILGVAQAVLPSAACSRRTEAARTSCRRHMTSFPGWPTISSCRQ